MATVQRPADCPKGKAAEGLGSTCARARDKSPMMGRACFDYLRSAVLSNAPKAKVFLLGPSFPPNWVDDYRNRTKPDSIIERLFRTINEAAGVTCKRAASGLYRAKSRGVVAPIDRYNVVGHRKRDGIHPFPNAHAGVVDMIINHMCRQGDTSAPARAASRS